MASVHAPPGDISQDDQQQLQNLSIGGAPAAADQAANKKQNGGNGGEQQQQGAGEVKELDPEKAAKKVRLADSAAARLCSGQHTL
jgi:hypothetical protein